MRAAAKKLGVSHSTVSRRIDSLESQLSARLFDRLPDGYQLTKAGRELLPIANELRQSVDAYHLKVLGRDTELEGTITVTMPDAAAITFLMPYIAEFQRQYPGILVKIDDSFAVYDLTRREADIAMRFTNAPPEHLIGRKIGTVYHAVYATQAYIDTHQPMAANSTAQWIAWGLPTERPDWIAKSPFPNLAIASYFDNVMIQKEAVRNNMGLGFMPCPMVDADPEFVRLTTPEPSFDFWILTHQDLRATARLKVFRQFFFERATEISALLRGGGYQGPLAELNPVTA